MVRGEGIRKVGGMWRVPTTLIDIYKYIKYAIKIVNSFPLHLLEKLLLEEYSLNPDNLRRSLYAITMKMASAVLCCFFTTEKLQSARSWLCALSNVNIQCLYFPLWTLVLRTGPQVLERRQAWKLLHKCLPTITKETKRNTKNAIRVPLKKLPQHSGNILNTVIPKWKEYTCVD